MYNKDKGIKFINGDSSKTNLESNSIDYLTSFHTLEHIKNLTKTMSEIKRVLKRNGYLIIEVPDAFGYKSNEKVLGYWFTIREHIHHFNENSLTNLLKDNFQIIKIIRQKLYAPTTSYPSLTIIAKNNYINGKSIQSSVKGSELIEFKGYLNTIYKSFIRFNNLLQKIANKKTICFWGLSNIFFHY